MDLKMEVTLPWRRPDLIALLEAVMSANRRIWQKQMLFRLHLAGKWKDKLLCVIFVSFVTQ